MGMRQASEIYGTIVLCQFLAALVCLHILIPQLLNRGKVFLFVASLVILMFLLFALYITIRMNYLEVKYFEHYNKMMSEYLQLDFWDRLFDFRVLLSKGINYLSPTAFLLLIKYYKRQKDYLLLNEQKKIAELRTLKNQLNPHFLFNTLNNLYSLAIKKSDKTPEVISKLSDILDYMLYRCNDKFVSLDKEIILIENYITLEKIRYGNRVQVNFEKSINAQAEIAPLILLTFVENAFKHGVSQEINMAEIDITLTNKDSEIIFIVKNTIPAGASTEEDGKQSIGMANVKQQLELLYPDKHQLEIDHNPKLFCVRLKLLAV